jgi:hypothetical protein
VVYGPISAMIASLWRLKWSLTCPHLFVDDTGVVFDLRVDPPVVLANAVKASVRRWRLSFILQKLPAARPSSPDYAAPTLNDQLMYCDGLSPRARLIL